MTHVADIPSIRQRAVLTFTSALIHGGSFKLLQGFGDESLRLGQHLAA